MGQKFSRFLVFLSFSFRFVVVLFLPTKQQKEMPVTYVAYIIYVCMYVYMFVCMCVCVHGGVRALLLMIRKRRS